MSNFSQYFRLTGYKVWTASLLPALAGTTLPFWLRPPGFSFKAFAASAFLILILSFHAGFSLLNAYFKNKTTAGQSKSGILLIGLICLFTGVLIGLSINNHLRLNPYVYKNIFIVWILSTIIIGMLYVIPPFSFFKRTGGETILCVGFGMMPLLGAYIVQAGDLTRTVYLASLPMVVSTGLWVWISELIHRPTDKDSGYKTSVMLFPVRFAGRFVTPVLTLLIYLTLVAAVLGRSSLNPLSLTSMLSLIFALKIIRISINEYEDNRKMQKARRYAYLIHLVLCFIIILSSLSTWPVR